MATLVNHAQIKQEFLQTGLSWPTLPLAVVVAFSVGVGDVLEREEEENHFALLVLDGHDVQQTPEGHTCSQPRNADQSHRVSVNVQRGQV